VKPSPPSRTREQLLAKIKSMALELQNGNTDVVREAQLMGQIGLLYDKLFAMDPDGSIA